MKKFKDFVRITVMGGLLILLPSVILFLVFKWVFDFILSYLEPLTQLLSNEGEISVYIAQLLSILVILLSCFLLGFMASRPIGRMFVDLIEQNVLSRFPGYTLVRESLAQFLGNRKSPFSRVAICDIFNSDTRVTAFVTDEHEDGSFTVFVPTGPNPTSGQIFHLPDSRVTLVDVPMQDAMRSIISCGAGSTDLLAKARAKESSADDLGK